MADKHGTPAAAEKPAGRASAGPSAAPKGNPAFRMLGMPNFRLRLPSRNWLIFLSITGSWTTALIYDRREKKRIQKKWCDLVSHIAQETLPQSTLPRKVTIFLSAPPGDGLTSIREHFKEYVKPVLVAAALDWDVVEGRREGTVRAMLAERIRKSRIRQGETSSQSEDDDRNDIVEALRARAGIQDWTGVKGDIILGRHTWKEYIRGLHEGWLGPMDDPASTAKDEPSQVPKDLSQNSPEHPTAPQSDLSPPADFADLNSERQGDDASFQSKPTTELKLSDSPVEVKEEQKKEPPPKPLVQPPYNTVSDYSQSTPPSSMPVELTPSATIPFPHILGFLNTPIRMYRFLTRRHLADDIGKRTAAVVLEASRPFHSIYVSTDSGFSSEGTADDISQGERSNGQASEQQRLLVREEQEWPKAVRQRESTGDSEKVWTDEMVLDVRIAERMRVFELEPMQEERARRIDIEGPILANKPREDEGALH